MHSSTLMLVIIIISLVIVTFFTTSLRKFNEKFQRQVDINLKRIEILPQFSYDIKFDPFPYEIIVDNPYECTPKNLHICDTMNSASCFGCKTLIAKCTHYDQDTKYIASNGETSFIPANKTETEGYCMVVEKLSQACNSYHGDFVLTQLSPDAAVSGLICDCKNPGYIGNMEMGGNCTDVFICNGKIDNINQPLDKIKCICEDGFVPVNDSATPFCEIESVKNHKYTSVDFINILYATATHMNSTYAANATTEYFRNPCRYCALTGRPVDGTMKKSDDGYQCVGDWDCIPVRLYSDNRILKGKIGPDAVIRAFATEYVFYGYFSNSDYPDVGIRLHRNENQEFFKFCGIDDLEGIELSTAGTEAVFPGNYGYTILQGRNGGECVNNWPFYQCRYGNLNNEDSSSLGKFEEVLDYIALPNQNFVKILFDDEVLQPRNFGPYIITIEDTVYRLQVYLGRPCPSAFLWSRELWDMVETAMNPIYWIVKKNKMGQLVVNPQLYGDSKAAEQTGATYFIFPVNKNQRWTLKDAIIVQAEKIAWREYILAMLKVSDFPKKDDFWK